MRSEYRCSPEFPKEFSNEEKLDHVQLMNDTLVVLWANEDQVTKAIASKDTPEAIEDSAYTDLVLRGEVIARDLRSQIRAAQAWMGSTALADFDLRLPEATSIECEQLISEYQTYRTILGNS